MDVLLGKLKQRLQEAHAPPPQQPPDDAQVLRNAQAACSEIRRHIDHQVKASDSLDLKGAALLALTATVAAAIIPQLHLDSFERVASGAVTGAVVLSLLLCCFQAIRPRRGMSYGADPPALVALVDAHPHLDLMLAMADSLRDARNENVSYLRIKHRWFQNALGLAVVAILALAAMVYYGGIRDGQGQSLPAQTPQPAAIHGPSAPRWEQGDRSRKVRGTNAEKVQRQDSLG